MANKKKTIEDFKEKHDPAFLLSPIAPLCYEIDHKATQRYIVTSAQNATPVNADFWAVLENMSSRLSAPLMVIPVRYKNPTSLWSGSQQNAEWYDPKVRPYLWNQREPLHEHLTLLADMKIVPTASNPLSGAEALSLSSSGILAHPKIQTKAIAVPTNKMAKVLMTSGSCTISNYTDSRSGHIGDFHHSLSAVLVEKSGDNFHVRRLHYSTKSNSVTTLGKTYYAGRGPFTADRALALVMGDTHVDFVDPAVVKATFGSGGLLDILKPKFLIWHDLLDGYSVNPHHSGNPFNAIAKSRGDLYTAKGEVFRAIDFVRAHTPPDTQSIIVPANHNDFLRRWVLSHDWKSDPDNAEFYLETALAMARGTRLTDKGAEYPDPFAYWFNQRNDMPNCRILDINESFSLGGVELALHGDKGPNGARGSIANLRRMGTKSIIGHSHSPGEDEGCTQVGTSTKLRLEYNTGPSSWLNAHANLNADEKRELIMIIDGEFQLED